MPTGSSPPAAGVGHEGSPRGRPQSIFASRQASTLREPPVHPQAHLPPLALWFAPCMEDLGIPLWGPGHYPVSTTCNHGALGGHPHSSHCPPALTPAGSRKRPEHPHLPSVPWTRGRRLTTSRFSLPTFVLSASILSLETGGLFPILVLSPGVRPRLRAVTGAVGEAAGVDQASPWVRTRHAHGEVLGPLRVPWLCSASVSPAGNGGVGLCDTGRGEA